MAISALKPQFITTAKTKEGNDYKKSSIAAKTGALAGAALGVVNYRKASNAIKDAFDKENGIFNDEMKSAIRNVVEDIDFDKNFEEGINAGIKAGKKVAKGISVGIGLVLTGLGFLAGKLIDLCINKYNAKSADKAAQAADIAKAE